jgi:hypothetical protein
MAIAERGKGRGCKGVREGEVGRSLQEGKVYVDVLEQMESDDDDDEDDDEEGDEDDD